MLILGAAMLLSVLTYLFCMQEGCTALMHAAFNARTDIVELLLRHGADVNHEAQVIRARAD